MIVRPLTPALSLAIALTGCSHIATTSPLPSAQPTLTGHWTLVSASKLDTVPAGEISLHVRSAAAGDNRRLSATGYAGVNQYVATVTLADGQRIHFGPPATTRRAGSPERMDFERAFLKELEGVAVYTLTADQLELKTLHGDTLLFSPRPE